MAGHLKQPVKWILENIDPVELRLWEAYYAVEPFGHELEFLIKLLAVGLKRGPQWEELRPLDVSLLNNRYEQIDLSSARKHVATAFQSLAQQLLNEQAKQKQRRKSKS